MFRNILTFILISLTISFSNSFAQSNLENKALNFFMEELRDEYGYDQNILRLYPNSVYVDLRFYDFPRCFPEYVERLNNRDVDFLDSHSEVDLNIKKNWKIMFTKRFNPSKKRRIIEVSNQYSLIEKFKLVVINIYEPYACTKIFIEFDENGNILRHCKGGYIN